jgi:glycerol-3-phosphate acyltransferase PlsY
LVAVGIFIVVVAIFRYVSLASIIAVASLPLLFIFETPPLDDNWITLLFMTITSLLIIGRHHENIRRLLAGSESRVGSERT